MKKAALVIASALLAAACFCGCQKATTAGTETEATKDAPSLSTSGGYMIADNFVEILSDEDEKKAFEEATDDLTGVDYTPICSLGRQTVAGTNYAILAKAQVVSPDSKPELKVLFINAPLGEKAKLDKVADFDVVKYIGDSKTLPNKEDVAGGWMQAEAKGASLPENAATAFSAATQDFDGALFTPLAYVASQMVAGTNHAIICNYRKTGAESPDGVCMLVIYEPLSGAPDGPQIISICDIDVASLK